MFDRVFEQGWSDYSAECVSVRAPVGLLSGPSAARAMVSVRDGRLVRPLRWERLVARGVGVSGELVTRRLLTPYSERRDGTATEVGPVVTRSGVW